MLQKVTDLHGSTVEAIDGEVGRVEDIYIDDERWGLRYLVVDTGGWLEQRRVLVSPASVRREASSREKLRVDLTREQVRGSPPMESDMPVSRRYEARLAGYYRYPFYWYGPLLWGGAMTPYAGAAGQTRADLGVEAGMRDTEAAMSPDDAESPEATHLRSCRELIGYEVQARDGPVGQVDDFLVDDADWSVRSVVVDTRKWLPGGQVTVQAGAVSGLDWSGGRMELDMDKEAVRQSPALA